jgi:predicted P-loop ATPase
VRIESRPGRAKLLYALAKPLPSFKLPPGLELRCAAANGLTVQDVLPPSTHPDTQRPYAWGYGSPAGHWSLLAPLPGPLLSLWQSLIRPVKAKRGPPPKAAGDHAPRLRALLADLDPDMSYDKGHPNWIGVGMALHYETGGSETGLALWNEWSATGQKYKGIGDLESHWRSFRIDHENPRTVAGLRKSGPASADEFPELPATPTESAPAASRIADPPMLTGEARERALSSLRGLKRGRMGTIESRLSNVVSILGVPEVSGADLALDTFRDEVMVKQKNADWRPFTDTDYTTLRVWLETAGNCDPIGQEMIRHAVQLVAERNRVDTAQLWLERLQWDGTPRLARFCAAYLGTLDTPYESHVGSYLWSALAGRVMSPGCQADMVPVLIGRQGVGKSRGVQAIVPAPEHFAELRLDEPDDSIARKMRGVLVAEFAEMRGLRAADVERTKAFVTRTHEKWTPKYQEFSTSYARRFLIIGTTNDEEFLPADTEHRRWLPVHVDNIDVGGIARDRDQLWAEALVYWRAHGIAWRGLDTLAKPAREKAAVTDHWQEQIATWLDENPAAHYRMSDILTNAVGLDTRNTNRSHELRVGRVLHALGYVRKSQRDSHGRVVKCWVFDPTS